MDCLVCHEDTGTYKKFPAGAGNPVSKPTVFSGNGKTYLPPEWNKVAQSVTRPTRQNCGTCHFYGGGGDGVKHGDLDSSLFKPDKHLDVHMGVNGQNFDCTRCHSTTLHKIAGRIYAKPAATEKKSLIEDDLATRITCVSCHSSTPHKEAEKANDHTDKVACQACHIPEFARVNPTKMWWDWSKAGKKKDGKPFVVKDEFGKPAYDTKKGEFVWKKNVQPEYFWYNGSLSHITLKDRIDPTSEVRINPPVGSADDPNSRIFPFKVHRAMQPYDKVNKTLVAPHLFPKSKTDKAAYWKGYDWNVAIKFGQEYAGLEYSGEFDFVETDYWYPTTHMVAPKEDVVKCQECHTREGSRLAKLSGFYMPGRDHFSILDTIGWLVAVLSLLGIAVHAISRIVVGIRNNTEEGRQ